MSFKDIEIVRVVYIIKDVIKGKGKRGRKYKSTTVEADEPEPDSEPEIVYIAEEVINGRGKRSRKH
jgi:hypothetical protein